ncbi:MAG TPA: hypothetical protein DD417_15940 [Elusimicrobia bacterium]|nr:hypothetical protein [Elusimicrobiota bacterium]
MTRILTEKQPETEETPIADRPAASLLRSWGKRMSQGGVTMIPIYIGGNWSLAVPRGNKRILQLSLGGKGVKS